MKKYTDKAFYLWILSLKEEPRPQNQLTLILIFVIFCFDLITDSRVDRTDKDTVQEKRKLYSSRYAIAVY